MTKEPGFDVEVILRLANGNPREFVRCREELIKRLVGESCKPASLANLQMQLDVLRYSSVTGGQTLERMSEMIRENAARLRDQVTKLNALLDDVSGVGVHE